MLFAQKTKDILPEAIITSLHTGGKSGASLLAHLRTQYPRISKETYYRTLRSLLREEVVAKHAKTYELNRHWLQRLYRFSKPKIEKNHGIDSDHILSFQEGDKITYTFKSPNLMGIYWGHTYDMIFERHDPQIPILIYHPHEWLIHSRVASETFFLKRYKEDKKRVLYSIGGTTELDKQFKKDWANTYLEIAIGASYGLKNTEYLNVLGDFIFRVTVSTRFAKDIDAFFKKYKAVTDENRQELLDLCNRKDTVKMVFTRSKKEADKWRAKYKKDYFMTRS